MKNLLTLCVLVVLAVSGCDAISTLNEDAPSGLKASSTFDSFSAAKIGHGGGSSTIVVTGDDLAGDLSDVQSNPTSWFFYQDWNGDGFVEGIDPSLGSFVVGPGTAPAGLGSAEITTSGPSRPNLATYQFSGVNLADITELAYSTYNSSAGNAGSTSRAAYLQFNVDFDGSDSWQRRLVFLPNENGSIQQDSWQKWDAIANGNALWRYSGGTWPVTGGSGTKSWAQILSEYPGVRIRVTDSWLGMRVGEPYPDGFTENIDKFVFGTAAGTTTFDFEPGKDACKDGGWQQSDNPTFKNQGQCIQYVITHL